MTDELRYDFGEKVAIITGAAHGIGEAVATRFAQGGARVVLADINVSGAESVAANLGGSERAMVTETDVTVPDSVAELIDRTMEKWGRIDILINNASNVARIGDRDGEFLNTTMDTWDEVYAANLRGPAAACRFAIPHMIAGGGGSIVNVGSLHGLGGDLVRTAYASTKAALMTLTKCIATEFGHDGIRCNSVAPGLILSPPARRPEAAPYVDLVSEHTALAGVGYPEDMAEVICFLASDASRWVSGENINVDGGLMAQLPWVAALRKLTQAAG